MKTKKYWAALVLIVAFVGSTAAAKAALLIPIANQAKENAKADSSPVIKRVDDHLILTTPGLERIVLIHYKKGFAKPPWAGGGGGGKKEPKCYEFLGRGVEWKEFPVSYVIDPDGLPESFVTDAISAGAEEWDSWTGEELFNDTYTVVSDGSWDSDAPDGRNELLFGNYPEEGVIGVTVIWGYFSGPPSARRIIEFDILFDTDFTWGNATDPETPDVMDLQNIAAHELGHGVGMGDIYDTVCSEITMYGYSVNGEIIKRTLELPDIAGIQKLYGE